MKKRIFAVLMVFAFAGILFAGGGQTNRGTATGVQGIRAGSDVNLSQLMTLNYIWQTSVRDVNQTDLFARFIRERFNTIINVTEIPGSDFGTRMSVMHAAGQVDGAFSVDHGDMPNQVVRGHLRGFSEAELRRLVPNYVNHFARDAWPIVWANTVYSDGLLYFLPPRRPHDVQMTWTYRADIFERYGLTFPETTEDLFNVLVRLRRETGMYPIMEANAGAVMWTFAGFYQAFGMPELSAREEAMVNPRTGEYVPYVYITDNYRRDLSYLNRLYANDLMWPEFATATGEQRNSMQARGHSYVRWRYPGNFDVQDNPMSRQENPNARWDWSRNLISENPANGFFFRRDPFFASNGPGFGADISDAALERFLYILNWFYSDEGIVFNTYGIENVHFTRQGNNYVYMPHMTNPNSPQGLTLENYGWVGGLSAIHPNRNEFYSPIFGEIRDAFVGRPNFYFHISPVYGFTVQETTMLADVLPPVNQARNEYFARFIMGHLNVNSDAEWQSYLNALNQLGVQRVLETRRAAWQRVN